MGLSERIRQERMLKNRRGYEKILYRSCKLNSESTSTSLITRKPDLALQVRVLKESYCVKSAMKNKFLFEYLRQMVPMLMCAIENKDPQVI
jgi:hypothetical protein